MEKTTSFFTYWDYPEKFLIFSYRIQLLGSFH